MRKELQKSRYMIAGFITTLVFLMAFVLGTYMESVRNDVLTENLESERYQIADLVLQYQMLEVLEEEQNCAALQTVFQESLKNLNVQSERLQYYEGQRKISETDFTRLRSAYTISQVNYWMLARDLKKTCNMRSADVLYFFAEDKDCPDCENQGIHLDYVKKKMEEELLVFALDGGSEGITQMLMRIYGVKVYPSLVINGELYPYSTNEELIEVLCAEDNYTICSETAS